MKPDGARVLPTGRLLAMAQRIAHADPVLDRVYPSLVELRDATKETVVFAKLSQDARVVYLDVLDSPHTIRYAPVAGEFKSIHANSLGKALISLLDEPARAAMLADVEMTRYNERTLTTPAQVEADIGLSRQRLVHEQRRIHRGCGGDRLAADPVGRALRHFGRRADLPHRTQAGGVRQHPALGLRRAGAAA